MKTEKKDLKKLIESANYKLDTLEPSEFKMANLRLHIYNLKDT